MKTNHLPYIFSIVVLLLFGCKKEGEFLAKPIKAIKPYDIRGYAVGDVLEQYFDGVKIRDYYGRITTGSVVPQITFENDVTLMQLKKKSTGEVVYEQKFNINDAKNEVPIFYFDGNKISNTYSYPKAQGTDFLMNFLLDGPKELGPIDIQMDVMEYYYDSNNQLIIVNTTSFPIASNISFGKWTDYFTVKPPTNVTTTQPGTDLYPLLTLKNSKTKKYLISDDLILSSIQQAALPDQWTLEGKTQSFHVQTLVRDDKTLYFDVNDLIQMFP